MPIEHSKAIVFKVALVAFLWCYSIVHFHMCPQNACLKRCIVTLVTYDLLFFTVYYEMSPEFACLRRCMGTLVAFDWLFSTVCFQKSPERACLRRCIVTLVAFFGFSSPRLLNLVINFGINARDVTQWPHFALVAFVWLYVFKGILKSPVI